MTAELPPTFEGNPFTFHALRQTFLTLLSISGAPEDRIARLAGHGAKTVTQRHYVARDLPLLYESVLGMELPKSVGWAGSTSAKLGEK